MLHYFNVQLFDNTPIAVALVTAALGIVARFNVAVFKYCILFDVGPFFNIVLFNVALLDVALFDVAIFNVSLFTVVLS